MLYSKRRHNLLMGWVVKRALLALLALALLGLFGLFGLGLLNTAQAHDDKADFNKVEIVRFVPDKLMAKPSPAFASDKNLAPVWSINADVSLTLSDEVHSAAEKGLPLYFTYELRIYQNRWLFSRLFSKLLIQQSQSWRIAYSALTRQWVMSTNNEPSSIGFSLDEALERLTKLVNWQVNNGAALSMCANDCYGEIRLKLDTSLLSRPFQITAFQSSAWSLSTAWLKFKIPAL